MTDINQLVEVGARAQMASAAYSSFWSVTDHKVMIKEGILAILPLLADDLAGLAEAHSKARYNARDNAKARKANQEARDHESMAIEGIHIAQAIRTRIAAIIEGEGK